MTFFTLNELLSYWTVPMIGVNLIVLLHLLGALFLGLLVGYERSYHGRAAGMRTYALVCMASTAIVVIVGYPDHWFAGRIFSTQPDLTRVIQGILTGIGFLCAGVIMREGLNISGLTTAASIWTASVIGVLIGVGFYVAAILLAFSSYSVMMWGYKLEIWLPSRHAIAVTLRFAEGIIPSHEILKSIFREINLSIATGTISISSDNHYQEWRFVAVAVRKKKIPKIPVISRTLATIDGIENFYVSLARN